MHTKIPATEAESINLNTLVTDPSLFLALLTGTALTTFLAAAHACCLGFGAPVLPALESICRFAG